MLVWEEFSEPPNTSTVAGSAKRRSVPRVCESDLNILRDRGRVDDRPSKIAAAMIDAFNALVGCLGDSIETRFAQWRQTVVRALQVVARRLHVATVERPTVTQARAVRRVKAFFVSQKVNGRNAPSGATSGPAGHQTSKGWT